MVNHPDEHRGGRSAPSLITVPHASALCGRHPPSNASASAEFSRQRTGTNRRCGRGSKGRSGESPPCSLPSVPQPRWNEPSPEGTSLRVPASNFPFPTPRPGGRDSAHLCCPRVWSLNSDHTSLTNPPINTLPASIHLEDDAPFLLEF